MSLGFGWGLAGIWTGLSLFMLLRLVAVLTRLRSGPLGRHRRPRAPDANGTSESPTVRAAQAGAGCVTGGGEDPAVSRRRVWWSCDKPAGLTSHDVVARLRRILGTRKIGHAGTLDPMATGVLVCGVGRGTRLLGHLALDTKAYTATIRLGAATSTDDAEGEIVGHRRPGRRDRRARSPPRWPR